LPYRLIIIPLINISGYKIGHSRNPIDGKYPKLIYPGSPYGTMSEKLIYWLSTYVCQSSLWIDLHGGATDEILLPCILAAKTDQVQVDSLTYEIISQIQHDATIYDLNSSWQKIYSLSKQNCSYLIFESGDSGKCKSGDVDNHIKWVKTALDIFGRDSDFNAQNMQNYQPFYTNLREVYAKNDCYFYPRLKPGDKVHKSQLVGNVSNLTLKNSTPIYSPENGILLWQKHECPVSRGETLFAIAS
jgi:predicted deacylase